MNIILDVLQLRRVKLDYISPPICLALFSGASGSGSSIMMDYVMPEAPTNLELVGQCARFLVWEPAHGEACVSLYRAAGPGTDTTTFEFVSECVPEGYVQVVTSGWWKYTFTDAGGTESAASDPLLADGVTPLRFPVARPSDAPWFNLYKDPVAGATPGEFELVLSTDKLGAIEVWEPSRCYRLQALTSAGVSELSEPTCWDPLLDCCLSPGCPVDYYYDKALCSCVRGSLISDILCPGAACINQEYSSQVILVGGSPPVLWELISGELPPGLTLHTGLFSGYSAPITGTPTAGGYYTFTVKATTSDPDHLYKTCILGVISTTTLVLPDATIDTPYSYQLEGTGGVGPYTFTDESPPFDGHYGDYHYSIVLSYPYVPPVTNLWPTGLPRETGITMDANGLITGMARYMVTGLGFEYGIPFVGAVWLYPRFVGNTTVSIRVTDSTGASCVVEIAIPVVPCPDEVSLVGLPYWGLYDNPANGNDYPTPQDPWTILPPA